MKRYEEVLEIGGPIMLEELPMVLAGEDFELVSVEAPSQDTAIEDLAPLCGIGSVIRCYLQTSSRISPRFSKGDQSTRGRTCP